MTAETRLAQARIDEREALREKCAKCGHWLAAHSRVNPVACNGRWDQQRCRCLGFVDQDEKLALDG